MSDEGQRTEACARVDEALAEVLDGTAPADLMDHVAGCDRCRDLRHDASLAAELVARASGDHRADPDLVERVLRRLEDGPSLPASVAASTTDASIVDPLTVVESAPTQPRSGAPLPTGTLPSPRAIEASRSTAEVRVASSAAGARSTPEVVSGAAQSDAREPARVEAALPKRVPLPPWRRGWFWGASAAGVAAAIAASFLLGPGPSSLGSLVSTRGVGETKVLAVSRAGADASSGLEACDANGRCAAIGKDDVVEAGQSLRTDARTRALLALADGGRLSMDRATEVALADSAAEPLRLARGAALLDTPEHGQVKLAVWDAVLALADGKASVTATDARVTVAVARGRAQLAGGRADVDVRAGEEASWQRGAPPSVAAAADLGSSVAWEDDAEADTLRGVGELRARKPGSTGEKDRAVQLAQHSVKVRIVDAVARTEVDETFQNDTDEELEGIYRFPLPPGAQIERLALEVDGKLVDGAFVDRDRGAAIWRGVLQNAAPKAPRPREEIIWVAGPWRDPALLEWQRGGRFELRIFPIPRHGSRRVVLAYTQTVEQSGGVRRYTYPLAHDDKGTTRVGSFDLDVQVLGNDSAQGVHTRGYELSRVAGDAIERYAMHERGFVPAGDLTVEYALPDRDREVTAWAYRPTSVAAFDDPSRPANDAQRRAREDVDRLARDTSPYVAIALRPKLPRWQEQKERLQVIAIDASRSMVGERFTRATRVASAMVREMDRRDQFLLLACDIDCRSMPPVAQDGAVREGRGTWTDPSAPGVAAAQAVEAYLAQVEPDGASDLAAVARAAARLGGATGGRELRITYIGDGTPTVGPTRPATLEAAVRDALGRANATLSVVGVGADADATSLSALARGGGGVLLPYVPGEGVTHAALGALSAAYGAMLRDPVVELPQGLRDISPAKLDAVRAGGEVFVLARATSDDVQGTIRLAGTVGGERFEQTYPVRIVASTSGGNAFIPRLFAATRIADLELRGDVTAKPTIVELSRRFGVASRFTSLLVLESEAMFSAFGVSRSRAGADFTGEVLADSTTAEPDAPVAPEGEATEEAALGAASAGSLGSLEKEARRDTSANAYDDGFAAPPSGGAGRSAAGPAATSTWAPPASKPAPAKVAGGGDWDPAPRDWSPPPPPPRRMVPMRKVFDRKASFDAGDAPSAQVLANVTAAERGLESAPDSRDKTLALYAAYASVGRLGEAQELTARWSSRDALDPDALLARADLAARQGDRARALRILGGIADVRPNDRASLTRLADLHDAMGAGASACDARLALANVAAEPRLVADAIQCSDAQGWRELSVALRAQLEPTVRASVERLLATLSADRTPPLGGDVRVRADWSAPADLDVSLIDAQGHRLSWMGSSTKTQVSSRDATSPRTETLGLAGLASGTYVVEVSRAATTPGDAASVVHGEVTLTLPGGETRRVPFTLDGPRVTVGSLKVFFTSRLVPVEGWWGGLR